MEIILQDFEGSHLYIIDDTIQLNKIPGITEAETSFANHEFQADLKLVTLNRYGCFVFIYYLQKIKSEAHGRDALRKAGAELTGFCNKHKLRELAITNFSVQDYAAASLTEGMASSNYQFIKYRTDAAKTAHTLETIYLTPGTVTENEVARLSETMKAVYHVRDLVNEPLNYLSAEQLSEEIGKLGAEAGFSVTVLHKEQIEAEKMGGLLAVNRGSIAPPTFSIMEYMPENSVNEQPIVLVGKGIVYDTGGVSLKPTLNSMDRMKSDMSGAALVTGVMFVIAKLKLPLHLIALVPATDNRPGEDAYVPGDIITMYSGKTVEVLNTDAEGRLVLGDALHWAKRYHPGLVLDFATLTGAASAAIGEHGIVYMGTAPDNIKQAFKESGDRQHERLVEFPMWDEYGDQIKSEIADIKNVGGSTGGAITAGKFLEHFIDYPWLHFDIAGVSFATSKHGYLPQGGTAYGLRMVVDFLMNYK